jgi:two-component system sensor histidine kinase YesM
MAVRDSKQSFVIKISDTGVGITPERLAFIRDNLEHRKDITDGGAHIGVINVHQRNQFIFGEHYGLFVESSKEQGTTFSLRLPYMDQTLLQGGGKKHVQDSSGR